MSMDGVLVYCVYWPLTCRTTSTYNTIAISTLHSSLLHKLSPHSVSTVSFLATNFNTGTITVSLNYSNCHCTKLYVKSYIYSLTSNWTHSTIFSAFLVELNFRLTAHLEIWKSADFSIELFFFTTFHGWNRKHRSKQFLYRCLLILCRGNLFTKLLPSSGRLRFLHYPVIQASCHSMIAETLEWLVVMAWENYSWMLTFWPRAIA
jgi:hypothetical protein